MSHMERKERKIVATNTMPKLDPTSPMLPDPLLGTSKRDSCFTAAAPARLGVAFLLRISGLLVTYLADARVPRVQLAADDMRAGLKPTPTSVLRRLSLFTFGYVPIRQGLQSQDRPLQKTLPAVVGHPGEGAGEKEIRDVGYGPGMPGRCPPGRCPSLSPFSSTTPNQDTARSGCLIALITSLGAFPGGYLYEESHCVCM